MPRYDAVHYDPPAPLAVVILRPSDAATTGASSLVPDVRLPIDTGADVTLLPRSAVNASARLRPRISRPPPNRCEVPRRSRTL
jgi:hypothetical protein